MKKITILTITLATIAACSPTAGPDKTVGGAILGAGWGAGAGAVIGNQLDNVGPGAAAGAGIGMVQGAINGAAGDVIESEVIRQDRNLQALEAHNMANSREIARMQAKFDKERTSGGGSFSGVYQVFFDHDQTNMRSGSTANLEVIADSLKHNPSAVKVSVIGHTDDSGNIPYNQRLAEARARNVAGYLAARGISSDQILVSSFGAKRPIASNATEAGRQLNRRVDVSITK